MNEERETSKIYKTLLIIFCDKRLRCCHRCRGCSNRTTNRRSRCRRVSWYDTQRHQLNLWQLLLGGHGGMPPTAHSESVMGGVFQRYGPANLCR